MINVYSTVHVISHHPPHRSQLLKRQENQKVLKNVLKYFRAHSDTISLGVFSSEKWSKYSDAAFRMEWLESVRVYPKSYNHTRKSYFCANFYPLYQTSVHLSDIVEMWPSTSFTKIKKFNSFNMIQTPESCLSLFKVNKNYELWGKQWHNTCKKLWPIASLLLLHCLQ